VRTADRHDRNVVERHAETVCEQLEHGPV
jgi:hypothetical protein